MEVSVRGSRLLVQEVIPGLDGVTARLRFNATTGDDALDKS
jgi:hypothetical protein